MPIHESGRAVGIAQIHRDRHDRSVEYRGAPKLRRISHHTVIPDVLRVAVRIDAFHCEMLVPVGDRIDSRETETRVVLAIHMATRRGRRVQGMRVRDRIRGNLVVLLCEYAAR